jgi:hypothetical protein
MLKPRKEFTSHTYCAGSYASLAVPSRQYFHRNAGSDNLSHQAESHTETGKTQVPSTSPFVGLMLIFRSIADVIQNHLQMEQVFLY